MSTIRDESELLRIAVAQVRRHFRVLLARAAGVVTLDRTRASLHPPSV